MYEPNPCVIRGVVGVLRKRENRRRTNLRAGVLIVLYLLFGVIYLRLDTSDEGGVQSMVGVVFMTTIFTGIICMNSVMPVRVRERAVAFRERSSYMYSPVPYAVAHALMEVGSGG